MILWSKPREKLIEPIEIPLEKSGASFVLLLEEKKSKDFSIEIDYGDRGLNLPMQIVLQTEKGKYFRGNLNDKSYIPFKKTHLSHNEFKRFYSKKVNILICGILFFMIFTVLPKGNILLSKKE